MKTLLKIFIISSSLYACDSISNDSATNDREADSANNNTAMPPDSVSHNDNTSNRANSPDPDDFERETTRQITLNLISTKQEINLLRSEVSDSLIKSGLVPERRVLFAKTIQQLEASSDLVNKQLEQIFVTDLVNSQKKLKGIVMKMKGSEQELGGMIARLDRITNYMQVAATLIQSILPIPATPVVPPKSTTSK